MARPNEPGEVGTCECIRAGPKRWLDAALATEYGRQERLLKRAEGWLEEPNVTASQRRVIHNFISVVEGRVGELFFVRDLVAQIPECREET